MKLDYRPDIDGLRAIAVISVILYHAKLSFFGINLFTGGFLGVDIFFVISGFLITQQIMIEYKNKRNFSFVKFFIRRIKRLLPVLFLISLLCLIIGYFILLPSDLERFAKSIISQLIFLSNFNFWLYYHNGYMAEGALMQPFLHTWSLSTEEQYYLIFPAVLLLILKYLKKHLIKIILIGIICSLCLAQYSSLHHPSFSFYMLPFRAWEFLAGSFLAYLTIFSKKKFEFKNQFYSNLLTFLNFLIILYYISFFNSKYPHPSLYTFFVILSVCVVIYLNNKNNFIIKCLSNNYLTYIGLISYSLYLWHYPIFSFFRHLYGNYFEEMIILKVLIIILSFFLSHLTYNYVEKTFRNSKSSLKKLNFFLLPLLVMIILFSSHIVGNNGYPNKLNFTDYQKKIIENKDISPILKNKNILNTQKKPKLLIIGNSHGRDFYGSLLSSKVVNRKYELNYFSTQVHCIKKIIKNKKDLCQRTFSRDKNKMNKDIKNFLNSDIVVLKTKWYPKTLDNLDETINFLLENNKEIFLVSDFPSFNLNKLKYETPVNYNKNFQQKIFFQRSFPLERFILENNRFPKKDELNTIEKVYYSLIENSVIENNKFLQNKAKEFNIKYLDHFDLICDNKKKTCLISTINNKIIHRDIAGHITEYGGNFIVKKIIERNWFNLK
jgi:peptidoglycan/LPS O-acetylase OafA/YrhL